MTTTPRPIFYAYNDCAPSPIRADRWMWQTGDFWMAVAPGESEAEWFQDLAPSECPTPRVRPIDNIPTSGRLIFMRSDFTEVESDA